ncbi:MAG: 16S rRNA (uracil(1498)-N(3))-methyltransferase [Deltaproteobacteria bacterium]|nr:16S rRNA (uracil(1498)-N(3))-methyltransferase [Deltaproteobacteria bacterium]
MRPRYFVLREVELVTGETTLPVEAGHHVRDVLRLRSGSSIELSDGRGRIASAEVLDARREVRVRVGAVREVPRPSTRLTLMQAVSKSDKVDRVIRAAAELGISRFVPVFTERTVAEREHRKERWASIAEDAARVSGRPFLMEVEAPASLAELLGRQRSGASLCFAGDGARSFSQLSLTGAASVEALVGPEGGLGASELTAIERAGFTRVHLGPYTLRTETAGAAVAALLAFITGGLDEPSRG